MATVKKAKKRKSVYSPKTHKFWFHLRTDPDEPGKDFFKRAKVRMATEIIRIKVTAEDAKKALRSGGIGCTSKCTVANAVKRQKHLFRHAYAGWVDWFYSRCFIATKCGPDGFPLECVAYEHDNQLARDQDSSEAKLIKLIERLERDGPIELEMKPYRKRSEEGRSGKTRKSTGKRAFQARGAKLRSDVASRGMLIAAVGSGTVTV